MDIKVIQNTGTLLDVPAAGRRPAPSSRLICFNSILVMIFLLLGTGTLVYGQDAQVSGTVVDDANNSLPGVNIVVKGTTTGTTTGADGTFQLPVPSLQDTLVFSFIGFQRQEIPINGRETFEVQMIQETYSGEELVVVGYGTQTKETLTGSVSAVGGEELQKTPVTNVSNSIGGRLPGVVTVTGSGEPEIGRAHV